jgi:hypothetical protein
MALSAALARVLYFLEPMVYDQGLGKCQAGVIVSRQMNPKLG